MKLLSHCPSYLRNDGNPVKFPLTGRLDGALSNLVWWEVSLPMAGNLALNDL